MLRTIPTLLSLALGTAIVFAPSPSNIGSDNIFDSALAAKGGNGKGNGGGNGSNAGGGTGKASGASTSGKSGNANGAGKSASAKAAISAKTKTKTNHGSVASELGALNAAHASAQAFADAAPTSRVGRIAAYATQAAATAALNDAIGNLTLAEQNLATAQAALADPLADPLTLADRTQAVADAQAEYDAALDAATAAASDPAVTDAQAALDAAQAALADPLADPLTLADRTQAVVDAQADYDAALANAMQAATAQTNTLLDAAANKPTPLSEAAQMELDSLLEGKIDTTIALDPTP
jgi:hypothetical protein